MDIHHRELDLISEVTREAYIDETRGNEKVSNIEIRGKRRDGSFIDVLYSTRQIKVNNEPMILNIGHDITEQKKAEAHSQKLLEKKNNFPEELTVSNEELQSTTEELHNHMNYLTDINKKLEQSEEKFFKAFQSNPAPMSLSDGYKWLDVNESYSKLTDEKN